MPPGYHFTKALMKIVVYAIISFLNSETADCPFIQSSVIRTKTS